MDRRTARNRDRHEDLLREALGHSASQAPLDEMWEGLRDILPAPRGRLLRLPLRTAAAVAAALVLVAAILLLGAGHESDADRLRLRVIDVQPTEAARALCGVVAASIFYGRVAPVLLGGRRAAASAGGGG
jgi:hypothetical protein